MKRWISKQSRLPARSSQPLALMRPLNSYAEKQSFCPVSQIVFRTREGGGYQTGILVLKDLRSWVRWCPQNPMFSSLFEVNTQDIWPGSARGWGDIPLYQHCHFESQPEEGYCLCKLDQCYVPNRIRRYYWYPYRYHTYVRGLHTKDIHITTASSISNPYTGLYTTIIWKRGVECRKITPQTPLHFVYLELLRNYNITTALEVIKQTRKVFAKAIYPI